MIGQYSSDNDSVQQLKKHANSQALLAFKENGVWHYGVMTKQRDYYIYMYIPFYLVFKNLTSNVLTVIFIYLTFFFIGAQVLRGTKSKSLKTEIEKEKEYQNSLLEEAKKAEAANRAKTEFLQRMSHDIRTPINGIRGMLEMGDYYADDIQKQTECREKVKEASSILLELVNEVLDMSKLESGEIYLEEAPFSINEVGEEVTNVLGRLAEERGITIEEDVTGIEHPHLIGSPVHIKRLLMNILSNALKYNKENGHIYITCKEMPSDETDRAIIEFICRDTGIGMSEEFQKHMFEPFSQEQKGGATKFGGTGLGMSIAKVLAEKMGGTISFVSEVGVGTTFVVTIPFKIDVDAYKQETKQPEEKGSIKGYNILLVEDNELNMEIAEFQVKNQGATVTKAWNGQEAVDIFKKSKEGKFEAILMDVMMPVLNGYEATAKIRALDREDAKIIPIIAMTANAFTEDMLLSKNAGMNRHLAKPINVDLLVKVVSELVEKSRRR